MTYCPYKYQMPGEKWVPDFDDPGDLAPEERLAHIVRILALGAIRLAEAEGNAQVATHNGRQQRNGFETVD